MLDDQYLDCGCEAIQIALLYIYMAIKMALSRGHHPFYDRFHTSTEIAQHFFTCLARFVEAGLCEVILVPVDFEASIV